MNRMMRKCVQRALTLFFTLILCLAVSPVKITAAKVCPDPGQNRSIVDDSYCASLPYFDIYGQCCVYLKDCSNLSNDRCIVDYQAVTATNPGTPPQDSTVTDPGYGSNKICCPSGYYDTATPLGGGGICSALDIQNRNMEVACCQRIEGPYGTHQTRWAAKQECSQVLAEYRPDLCADIPESSPDKAKCNSCKNSKGVYTAIGCIKTSGSGVVTGLARFLLGIMGGVILIIILAAAFKLTTSRGDAKATESARAMITAAVSGALFVAFSMLILQTLGVQILQIPGL